MINSGNLFDNPIKCNTIINEMSGKKKTKKSSKRGRPPVANPKYDLLVIRVSEKEKKLLQKMADAAGMSLGAYVMAPHRKKKG